MNQMNPIEESKRTAALEHLAQSADSISKSMIALLGEMQKINHWLQVSSSKPAGKP